MSMNIKMQSLPAQFELPVILKNPCPSDHDLGQAARVPVETFFE